MRRLRFRDNSADSTFDLNLAPMMDMMVTIIPFMLLSATFFQLMLINVPLPTPVAEALQQDRDRKEQEFSIKIDMQSSKQLFLETKTSSGQKNRIMIERSQAGDFDFVTLHRKLVEIKQRHPKIFKLELNPDANVDYKSIVAAMDSARNMESKDPKVYIENAETPLLFPDVILANVMEE